MAAIVVVGGQWGGEGEGRIVDHPATHGQGGGARLGIRMAELLDEEAFRDRLAFVLAEKTRLLTQMYGEAPMDFEEVFSRYWSLGQRLARYIKPTERLVQEAAAAQRTIVLEGAQGTLLDPDYGTYPYGTYAHPA